MTSAVFPRLATGDKQLDRAWRLALGDLAGNTVPFKDGLLDREEPVFLAGLDYSTPWTRDAAINVWNGGGLLFPAVGRSTLLSVLERADGRVRIAGQYWDAIIWACGAWALYLYTGDRELLKLSLEAVRNSLVRFEAEEFDAEKGLFRGPACYGDGVAAYPDVYARTGGTSAILDWPKHNPQDRTPAGYGIPMHALSTNCLYYRAYVLAGRMSEELFVKPEPLWAAKAAALREAINRHFWMEQAGRYRYLADKFGGCDHQEGLGHSFAILLGAADKRQAALVLRNQHVTEQGIPCVWPTFPRYQVKGPEFFGRHSGTVWPHVQGFWAHAAKGASRPDIFERELRKLADLAGRSGEFKEIYHPVTGEPTGGEQEGRPAARPWKSCSRQTWSATAYLRMVLMGIFGMDFAPDGVRFAPSVPAGLKSARLSGLPYRGAELEIVVDGSGPRAAGFRLNGREAVEPFLPAGATGPQMVEIRMA